MARYVPDAGDIVWLQFDPQAGHEQAGPRPALVPDQVKSLDWVARKAKRKGKATPDEIAEVRAKILALLAA